MYPFYLHIYKLHTNKKAHIHIHTSGDLQFRLYFAYPFFNNGLTELVLGNDTSGLNTKNCSIKDVGKVAKPKNKNCDFQIISTKTSNSNLFVSR